MLRSCTTLTVTLSTHCGKRNLLYFLPTHFSYILSLFSKSRQMVVGRLPFLFWESPITSIGKIYNKIALNTSLFAKKDEINCNNGRKLGNVIDQHWIIKLYVITLGLTNDFEIMCTFFFIATCYGILLPWFVFSESFVSSAAEAIHSMYFGFAATEYNCICIGRDDNQA